MVVIVIVSMVVITKLVVPGSTISLLIAQVCQGGHFDKDRRRRQTGRCAAATIVVAILLLVLPGHGTSSSAHLRFEQRECDGSRNVKIEIRCCATALDRSQLVDVRSVSDGVIVVIWVVFRERRIIELRFEVVPVGRPAEERACSHPALSRDGLGLEAVVRRAARVSVTVRVVTELARRAPRVHSCRGFRHQSSLLGGTGSLRIGCNLVVPGSHERAHDSSDMLGVEE
mmetsp:Transcript_25042/g.64655  ORF Transcript_25042/g.64655 Transcript_25042/m.64655 type:complete len:228 (+) Transcript_25042:256-939(+)